MNEGQHYATPGAFDGHLQKAMERIRAATAMLDIVTGEFDIRSMLDVGCGVGAWIVAADRMGIEARGVEGPWIAKTETVCDKSRIIEHDLSTPLELGERFDLVTCIEVGEHLPGRFADTLVESLVVHGDIILFSAAVPLQGGAGHVNEQWQGYWLKKFEAHGYHFIDLVRPKLWERRDIPVWHQQNTLLLVSDTVHERLPERLTDRDRMVSVIHPRTYNRTVSLLRKEQAAPADPAGKGPYSGLAISGYEQALKAAESALKDLAPFSLIRLGHCEPRMLGFPDFFPRPQINRTLTRQFGDRGKSIPTTEVLNISEALSRSVINSDVCAIGIIDPPASELEMIWYATPIILKARNLVGAQTFCHVNVHQHMLASGFLRRTLENREQVTLITCRDIAAPMKETFGLSEARWIEIPEHAATCSDPEALEAHWPTAFERTMATIESSPPGLYLVGAGFLGKIYCDAVKRRGGQAIDIGSVFDVWAGVKSRTGHSDELLGKFSLQKARREKTGEAGR